MAVIIDRADLIELVEAADTLVTIFDCPNFAHPYSLPDPGIERVSAAVLSAQVILDTKQPAQLPLPA